MSDRDLDARSSREAGPSDDETPEDPSLVADDEAARAESEDATPLADILEIESERSFLDQLQRLQAEFSNYRKRITRERADWDARAKGEVLSLLIPVLDDLDRAREAHASMPPSPEAEGLLLILTRLEDALRQAGLDRQIPAPGTPFDPNEHEALMTEASEIQEEGTITGTLQPGYRYRGFLLRPARVRVSQGPPVASA